MDQPLNNSQPLASTTAFSREVSKRKFSSAVFYLAFALLMFSSGCQIPNMQASLPVPPPVLDVSSLDEVRYQSPDSASLPSSSRNQEGRIVSRNRLPFVDEQAAIRDAQPKSQPTGQQADRVAEVKIVGNRNIPTHQIKRSISTRPGRFFDPDKLQQDVNQLWRLPEIERVKEPVLEYTDSGVVVTLEITERAAITKVSFIGNRGISDKTLQRESGLEDGKPLDTHQIRMAKNRLEEFYKDKGYPRTQVEIMEGNNQSKTEVVFLIHEDEKQRIWKVDFEGNSIASDARLRHFIKSKPGILKVFGGLVKRDEIDQDITRLTGYYRSLGFFNARIGREISESNDGRWLNLRFIINEGPRYRIRNISFIGNGAYAADQLESYIEHKPVEGEQPEYNSAKMNQDVVSLRELYGENGFVFAKVEAELRFLEEPGYLDIVYKINEGKQYVVGNINVHYVGGGGGVTKRKVILDRLSLSTGQLVNQMELRESERRLGASQVFSTGQTGPRPRIVVRTPELKDLQRYAEKTGTGSSPRF